MDPFERAAKDPEDPQGSAIVWRLAWSQVGNCWLEAVEECKRLKREKGTHKKVLQDSDGYNTRILVPVRLRAPCRSRYGNHYAYAVTFGTEGRGP